MTEPEPVPRPGLMTNGDFDAWAEQFLFLRYTVQRANLDRKFSPVNRGFQGFFAQNINQNSKTINACRQNHAMKKLAKMPPSLTVHGTGD